MQQDSDDCTGKLGAKTQSQEQRWLIRRGHPGGGREAMGKPGGVCSPRREAQATCKNIWDAGTL